jgi:hypothetical protein
MIQKAGTGHRNHALHGFQDLELALSARFQHAVSRVHPDHELFAALKARRVQREKELLLGRAPRQPAQAAYLRSRMEILREQAREPLGDVVDRDRMIIG